MGLGTGDSKGKPFPASVEEDRMHASNGSHRRISIIPHLPLPMRLSATMAAAALLLASPPLRAQAKDTMPGTRPGWSVDRAMRVFRRDFDERAEAFFPRRGTWDYVTRTRDHTGAVHRGIHRFPAGQTDAAIDGPLCEEFKHGEISVMGSLAWYAVETETRWRRVSATRFQPRKPEEESTVFVDWRREDGRWVIAAIGSLSSYVPPPPPPTPPLDPLLGRRLRLPLAGDARVAGEMDWYRDNLPVEIAGHRRTKYGLPRELSERDVVYFTTFEGVEVYAEPSEVRSRRGPIIVYIPVDRTGMFQPYEGIFLC